MLPNAPSRSESIAVFTAFCLLHLAVTFVLFVAVLPQAKHAASTGVAGVALAILLFPVYLLDSFGANHDFPGNTSEFLYATCWLLSAFFCAFLATALFRYLRLKRSPVI
jgi:hypothetical protein